jgi:exonuclease SbcC
MIPQRIAVEGFLCYRDEQEIEFDSAALWMLAGLNGSGKSAVFDGMTYALFGGHRAGKEHADELINKNCDAAAVEFDFLLDGQLYRARRTIKRKKQGGTAPTQQMCRWEQGSWQAIPDTTNKRDFDRWVQENVGLTYETFTSSVLLMQGRAEKLLSATPKDRFEVLAGIVDLERFQRLHERADNRRRELKEQLEVLAQQLNRIAEVSEAELEEVEQRIATAEEALHQVQAEGERLQRLEVQAEQWQVRQAKLSAARQQVERAEQLRADAERIERDWARLRELRAIVPHLRAVLEQREQLAEVLIRSEQLAGQQRTLAERLGRLTTASEEKRLEQERLLQALQEAQQREQVVGTELRGLAVLLGCVNACERQRRELARIDEELAKLPADPTAAVAQAQHEHDRLTNLSLALPLLCRFRGEREELRQANQDEKKALQELSAVQQSGEELKPQVAAIADQVRQASDERRRSEERAAVARTLLDQAGRQLAQLVELGDATVCEHCGQKLTAEHRADERRRRSQVRTAAETECAAALSARESAVQNEARLLQEKTTQEKRLEDLRVRFRNCRQRKQEAEREAQRRGRECLRLYHEIPQPFRERIARQQVMDWMPTVFPRKEDLDLLHQETNGKAAAHRGLQEAQGVLERWNTLRVERETTQRALAAQEAELPGDVESVRSRHTELEAEDVALKQTLVERGEEAKIVQAALAQLEQEQRTIREQLSDLDPQWGAEQARQEEGQKALERARSALPGDWQTRADAITGADVQAFQDEQQVLEQAGVEARGQELVNAQTTLEALRQRVAELDDESNQIPVEARCEPTEIQERRAVARQEQGDRESAVIQAKQDHARLIERRDQRRQLQEQHASLDLEHNRQRLLSELLGRNRLQLFLVRQAERGIVDYANAVLDRLSGGQLYLRLRSDDESGTDQALQLEAYNRSTGQAPIGVAFLSGSQRFRVAVSLALGIGQYASKQHRPIESVIIDEGFGCLDRQGRQVMIQELQNLRGQLRCILLVSHQEEFAEAFADGYRFELNDGRTQVTRFQR